MKGYRKTVNHSRGTVRETYTNPVTGTRHTRTRKKTGIVQGLINTLVLMVAAFILLAVFGSKTPDQAKPEPTKATTAAVTEAAETVETTEFKGFTMDYLVNESSKVFHMPNAGHIDKASMKVVAGTVKELEEMGYTRCGNCWR